MSHDEKPEVAEELESPVGSVGPVRGYGEKLKSLDQTAINRFLREKWRNLQCEVCLESNRFAQAEQDAGFGILSAISKDDQINHFTRLAHVGLLISCQNCGNFKLLDVYTMIKWLDENPPS